MEFKIELKEVDSFIRVANAGSLTSAAQKHDIPKSTLSHHIRRLEDALGVELFIRSARKLELSEAGREFQNGCSEILNACDSACARVRDLDKILRGKLRIKIGTEFGNSIVGPLVSKIATEFPMLELEVLTLVGQEIHTEELDFDCLIYAGNPPDSELVGKLLGTFTYSLYASPDYLNKSQDLQQLEDLQNHTCLCSIKNGQLQHWDLHRNKKSADILPRYDILVDDYWMAKFFAVDGMGITYLPDFFVQNEVEAGALVRILEGWQSSPVPLYALYPKQRYQNRKVRLFVESCIEGFAKINNSPPPYTLIRSKP